MIRDGLTCLSEEDNHMYGKFYDKWEYDIEKYGIHIIPEKIFIDRYKVVIK